MFRRQRLKVSARAGRIIILVPSKNISRNSPLTALDNLWKGTKLQIMSKLKKILIGIGVFIVGVILLANSATKGLADVAQAQLAALRAGDVAGAYAYTSSDFQKAT